MRPAPPEYFKSAFYDPENDILKEGAPEEEMAEYEDLHNGYDWILSYRELEPDMVAPFKKWNGEIIDRGQEYYDQEFGKAQLGIE